MIENEPVRVRVVADDFLDMVRIVQRSGFLVETDVEETLEGYGFVYRVSKIKSRVPEDDNPPLFEVTNRDTGDSRRIRASSVMGAIKISRWPPDACVVRRINPPGDF